MLPPLAIFWAAAVIQLREASMMKLQMFVVMLALIVLTPGGASAVPLDEGIRDCTRYRGHMVWNWDVFPPWSIQTCFKCWDPTYCLMIICDLKECDETIIDRRVRKRPRILQLQTRQSIP
jgi:hypothetical protein